MKRLTSRLPEQEESCLAVLDCTLRDGGYVNNWEFPHDVNKRVLSALLSSGVEIIECGFINSNVEKRRNTTLYKDIEQVNEIVGEVLKDRSLLDEKVLTSSMFVVMANYGDFDFTSLSERSGHVEGIRVAFHKKDKHQVYDVAAKIISKGYKFFLQPMATSKYSSKELLELFDTFSRLDVYAYYVVDSFGSLTPHELKKLLYLFESNVDSKAKIGFHSHNNLQLAFANTIEMLREFLNTNQRPWIVDASIFGMGRGAGNLNTELFLPYCNKYIPEKKYAIRPLLEVIDLSLENIHRRHYWGYSVAHCMSAVHDVHPNYASYLVDKKKLSVVEIEGIISQVVELGLVGFEREKVEELYENHLIKSSSVSCASKIKLDLLKDYLILGPGPSVISLASKVSKFISDRRDTIKTISINHVPAHLNVDIVFFSNQKRLDEFAGLLKRKEIWITSNIQFEEADLVFSYQELLENMDKQNDNASILLLHALANAGVNAIYLAGIDGYDIDKPFNNYSYNERAISTNKEALKQVNADVAESMVILSKKVKLNFLTPSVYQKNIPISILGVIPSRYDSSRLPGKPLVKINGIPMIKRTYDRVKSSEYLDKVIVATDDSRVFDYCTSEQIGVVMTSKQCLTGTDRVAEVAKNMVYDFYVNIQGDEPIIDPEAIKQVCESYYKFGDYYDAYNLYKEVTQNVEIESDTIVKVVTNSNDELLYMSRQSIPYEKGVARVAATIKKQVCVYGFTFGGLLQFTSTGDKTANESLEDIEILRFIDLGDRVKMIPYKLDSISVDVDSDVTKVEAYLNAQSKGKSNTI